MTKPGGGQERMKADLRKQVAEALQRHTEDRLQRGLPRTYTDLADVALFALGLGDLDAAVERAYTVLNGRPAPFVSRNDALYALQAAFMADREAKSA